MIDFLIWQGHDQQQIINTYTLLEFDAFITAASERLKRMYSVEA
jgi:hypothetical protein